MVSDDVGRESQHAATRVADGGSGCELLAKPADEFFDGEEHGGILSLTAVRFKAPVPPVWLPSAML